MPYSPRFRELLEAKNLNAIEEVIDSEITNIKVIESNDTREKVKESDSKEKAEAMDVDSSKKSDTWYWACIAKADYLYEHSTSKEDRLVAATLYELVIDSFKEPNEIRLWASLGQAKLGLDQRRNLTPGVGNKDTSLVMLNSIIDAELPGVDPKDLDELKQEAIYYRAMIFLMGSRHQPANYELFVKTLEQLKEKGYSNSLRGKAAASLGQFDRQFVETKRHNEEFLNRRRQQLDVARKSSQLPATHPSYLGQTQGKPAVIGGSPMPPHHFSMVSMTQLASHSTQMGVVRSPLPSRPPIMGQIVNSPTPAGPRPPIIYAQIPEHVKQQLAQKRQDSAALSQQMNSSSKTVAQSPIGQSPTPRRPEGPLSGNKHRRDEEPRSTQRQGEPQPVNKRQKPEEVTIKQEQIVPPLIQFVGSLESFNKHSQQKTVVVVPEQPQHRTAIVVPETTQPLPAGGGINPQALMGGMPASGVNPASFFPGAPRVPTPSTSTTGNIEKQNPPSQKQ
jgi:hypothetical protein